MDPVREGTTLHCQGSKLSWLPQQGLGNLVPVPAGEVIETPNDDRARLELLKREDERQKLFDSESNEVLNIPNGYREAEVLIVRWDEELDEFPGHTEEIENLRHIFEHKFHFGCHIENLQNKGDPQLDLNHHILSHVRNHNGKKNLLIVYYTGHGNQDSDEKDGGKRLRLSPSSQRWNKSMGGFPAVAYWDDAEGPLLRNTASDVLVILDCCFASTAAVKSDDDDGRCYQMITACPVDGKTRAPGKGSFTEALCMSLEELGNNFSVLELVEKINTIRRTQAATIWDRLKSYKRTIQLEPLAGKDKREATFQNEELEQASLTLRLSLGVPDLDNNKIAKLARSLPDTCTEAGIPVHRVKWVRMEHRDAAKTESRGVGKIVRQFADELRLRALRSRSSVELEHQEGPGHEVSTPPTPLTPPVVSTRKRKREDVSDSDESPEPGLCTPSGSSARSRSIASVEGSTKKQAWS